MGRTYSVVTPLQPHPGELQDRLLCREAISAHPAASLAAQDSRAAYVYPIALAYLNRASILRIPPKANTDSEGNANGIPGRRRTVFGA